MVLFVATLTSTTQLPYYQGTATRGGPFSDRRNFGIAHLFLSNAAYAIDSNAKDNN